MAEAQVASIEDRVASAMGAAPPPEPAPQRQETTSDAPDVSATTTEQPSPDAPETPVAPEFEEIEWENGDRYEVPKPLKEAFMRTKDYTEKTTQLSQTRQAIEAQHKAIALFAEQRKFEQSMAEHVENLRMIDAYTNHVETQTDWSKLGTDQIVRARVELDQLRARRSQLQTFLGEQQKQFSTKMTAEREKIRKESQEALSKAIPKWSEESRQSVEKYVQGLGYPEVALPNMSQLDYQVAYKAMMYDKLKGEQGKVAEKVAEAKTGRPVKASARKVMSSETAKYLNFRKQHAKAPDQLTKNKLVEARIGEKFEKLLGG